MTLRRIFFIIFVITVPICVGIYASHRLIEREVYPILLTPGEAGNIKAEVLAQSNDTLSGPYIHLGGSPAPTSILRPHPRAMAPMVTEGNQSLPIFEQAITKKDPAVPKVSGNGPIQKTIFQGAAFPNPSKENCSFYTDLEKAIDCQHQKPPSSYLVNYGGKYCQRFLDARESWGPKLKTWAEETAFCLQNKVVTDKWLYRTCFDLEEVAFDSHPVCYKRYGICDLSFPEYYRIWRILSAVDISREFRRSFSQMLNVAAACIAGLPPTLNAAFLAIYSSTTMLAQADKDLASRIFSDLPPTDPEVAVKFFTAALPIVLFNKSDKPSIELSKQFVKYANSLDFGKSSTDLNHAGDCFQDIGQSPCIGIRQQLGAIGFDISQLQRYSNLGISRFKKIDTERIKSILKLQSTFIHK